ncbi:Dolichyl-diphosphooligosaccharide--protein glycosyltransferase subunit 1 [Fusarium oxysporum f. sp. albedinis]|nr:Dolichyl-diphosphooligosaccharide--protein glycosyltransferase subunit 1 [Fusarium oxysporum f. sp. albedinis]
MGGRDRLRMVTLSKETGQKKPGQWYKIEHENPPRSLTHSFAFIIQQPISQVEADQSGSHFTVVLTISFD